MKRYKITEDEIIKIEKHIYDEIDKYVVYAIIRKGEDTILVVEDDEIAEELEKGVLWYWE